jgi:hypothetical protein
MAYLGVEAARGPPQSGGARPSIAEERGRRSSRGLKGVLQNAGSTDPLSSGVEQRAPAALTGQNARQSTVEGGYIIATAGLSAGAPSLADICSGVRWRVL